MDASQDFILEHINTISNTPSEIYHHALPFSPSSWLHKYYSAELSKEVKVVRGHQTKQGAPSYTVSLNNIPQTLACKGGVVVVGFTSGNIIILDAATQIHMSVDFRHSDAVVSLALTSDGAFLASGGYDGAVKFWDIQIGMVIRTFLGHTNQVYSVAVSLNCITIASVSYESIRLWNVQTGECIHETANNINFSPINTPPMSVPFRGIIHNLLRSWDRGLPLHLDKPHPQVQVHGIQQPMALADDLTVEWLNIHDHQGWLMGACEGDYFAHSADGTHFVSWRGKVAMVRNSSSGETVTTLQAPGRNLQSCCFSPDGKLVVGAAYCNIYVWDITSSDSHPIKTIVAHTEYITSLTFSSLTYPPSLISSSLDKSIKSWDIDAIDLGATNSETIPPTIAPIKSISLPGNGTAISCDSAGVWKIWDTSTGFCKATFHTSATEIEWAEAEVVNNRLILGWCSGTWIHLYKPMERALQVIGVGSYFVTMSLKVSRDESKVFLLDNTSIRVWSTRTGEVVGNVMLEGKPVFNSLVVDGSRAWVRLEDLPIQGWDFGTTGLPTSPLPLPSSSLPPMPTYRLEFIDCTRARHTEPSRIEDTVTGEEVFRLSGKYKKPSVAQWDGRYLVAGYESGEVVILDFKNMIPS